MDNTYALRQMKKNAERESNLAKYSADQKVEPQRSAIKKSKGDYLYDELKLDVEKYKSDLENQSYLKGGKKKKKSSRKHGRTRSKRPSNTRRRRVSRKRNCGSRRK